MLVNVLNRQITTFENIPPLRREVVVHGDGNYFYRAVALWKDEISDGKHEEVPHSSDSLFKKNSKVFELQLFFSNSWKDLVKKSLQDHTNSGRICGHIIGCASLLKGPICITHRHRRMGSVLSRLLTQIRSHSSQHRNSVGKSALYLKILR